MTGTEQEIGADLEYECPVCNNEFENYAIVDKINGRCPHCLTKVKHRV